MRQSCGRADRVARSSREGTRMGTLRAVHDAGASSEVRRLPPPLVLSGQAASLTPY